jgi:hypothetical protein
MVSDARITLHDLVLMRCIAPKHALWANRRVECSRSTTQRRPR